MKQKNDVMNKASNVITSFIRVGMLKKKNSLNKSQDSESSLAEANRAFQLSLLNFRVAQEYIQPNDIPNLWIELENKVSYQYIINLKKLWKA